MAQRITPFLWFDKEAEEAARFYCSIFKNSEIGVIGRYGKAGPGPEGSVMTVAFKLDGMELVALNGGNQPGIAFNESVSLVVNCKDQKEVDYFWEKLGAGGKHGVCGWLKDKYGLSWQVIPEGIHAVIKSPKAMQAMMKMTKLDLPKLKEAAKG